MINISVKDLEGQVHEIQGREGESLMEALRKHEWGTPAICGGLCSCGTCHVYLGMDWLDKFPQQFHDEQDLLDVFESARDNSRLSCQLILRPDHDGLELAIAPED